MTTLLTVRPAPGCPPWMVDACPHAYDEAGRVQFKGMPGVQWVPDRDAPNGRGVFRGPIEAVRIVVSTLEAAGVVKVKWEGMQLGGATAVRDAGSMPAAFRDYQRDGVSWLRWMLAHSGGALLADEMGIGKTAQAIVALDGMGVDSVIVVCPAVVRTHWAAQVRKWSGDSGAREDASGWAVYSYEGFAKARKAGTLPDADAIVLDEIHYTSNPKAKRTQAIAAWCAAHPAALRVGLSGTPMTTRPRDLWQPLDILWPDRWGGWFPFTLRYCGGHYEEIPKTDRAVYVSDGSSRADELGIRLQACMLRRTKAEVLRELPPRQRVVHEVELPAKARRDLQSALGAIDWAGAGPGGSGSVRQGVSSLLSNIEEYKVTAACELATEVVAAGSRALVLTTRKATAHAIGEVMGAPVVDGDTDPLTRQAALADATVGVATMYSVTTGIDLTGYDVIVFTGLDWVPSTLLQAEARIHRIGQDRPCTMYYLIGVGTLDEVVRERVIERLDVITQVTGRGDEAVMAGELGGGSEDDLIASIVAAVKRAA